ncbi:helix-turn-helix transcriptional regulator [Macrococcus brunensis]|uniref:helix-turn-helix transcriptional regulator n=1 Tax=Macrococcus brunensis TaxID=198483 RepID=UPI001EF0C937|nr:helix-turn-helix transcriptional regulator [Macrococcus brunensis]ULG72974.1 helix-turn-helix transcriptional regulator [Macrococcus brunensis]
MKIHPKENLLAVMLSKGLSQQSISEQTGITYVTINKAFNDRGVSAKTAQAICKVLNVEFDNIFFVSSDNKSYQKQA